MPSAMPSFLRSLGIIILASLLISSISFEKATAHQLLQENSSSDPEPKHEPQERPSSNPMLQHKLPASSPSSNLYKPKMFRTLPSFQRRPMFPPRLLPVLPFPSKPTLPIIPSFPIGQGGDAGNVPDTSTSTPSTPPPPSWLSSENSPSGKQQQQHDHDTKSDKQYDNDKMAPEFPQP